jgi:uncharacterized Zn finger protein
MTTPTVARLLLDCNVTVTSARHDRLTARVERWIVKRRGDVWSCTCPAVDPWCRHIAAVARVTDLPASQRKRTGDQS